MKLLIITLVPLKFIVQQILYNNLLNESHRTSTRKIQVLFNCLDFITKKMTMKACIFPKVFFRFPSLQNGPLGDTGNNFFPGKYIFRVDNVITKHSKLNNLKKETGCKSEEFLNKKCRYLLV